MQHRSELDIHGTEVIHLDVIGVEVLGQLINFVESFIVYAHEANSLDSSRFIIILLLDFWVGLLDIALDVLPVNLVVQFLVEEEGSHYVWEVFTVFAPIMQMLEFHWCFVGFS